MKIEILGHLTTLYVVTFQSSSVILCSTHGSFTVCTHPSLLLGG